MSDLDDLLATRELPSLDYQLGEGVTVRFTALTRSKYAALIDLHPPGPEDREVKSTWNRATFPPAVIAACSNGAISVEQARRIWDEWDAGSCGRLFSLVYALNEDGVPFTVPGFARTRGSGPNSPTASPRASRTASSSPGRRTTKTKP